LLLVFGSAFDDHPKTLVQCFRDAGRPAALVIPKDLSRIGWSLRSGNPGAMTATVDDRILRGDEIRGVVTALPWVAAYDVLHVIEADRDYVAEEMAAFLLAWLRQLRCPVLDRPTPTSLAGCGRSKFEWANLARSKGVDADPGWTGNTIPVTVVCGRSVGDVPPAYARAAETISTAAGRSLVTLRFAETDTVTLVNVDPRAEVGSDTVAAVLLEALGT